MSTRSVRIYNVNLYERSFFKLELIRFTVDRLIQLNQSISGLA